MEELIIEEGARSSGLLKEQTKLAIREIEYKW